MPAVRIGRTRLLLQRVAARTGCGRMVRRVIVRGLGEPPAPVSLPGCRHAGQLHKGPFAISHSARECGRWRLGMSKRVIPARLDAGRRCGTHDEPAPQQHQDVERASTFEKPSRPRHRRCCRGCCQNVAISGSRIASAVRFWLSLKDAYSRPKAARADLIASSRSARWRS